MCRPAGMRKSLLAAMNPGACDQHHINPPANRLFRMRPSGPVFFQPRDEPDRIIRLPPTPRGRVIPLELAGPGLSPPVPPFSFRRCQTESPRTAAIRPCPRIAGFAAPRGMGALLRSVAAGRTKAHGLGRTGRPVRSQRTRRIGWRVKAAPLRGRACRASLDPRRSSQARVSPCGVISAQRAPTGRPCRP